MMTSVESETELMYLNMDGIVTTTRDLELEASEKNIKELIIKHENDLMNRRMIDWKIASNSARRLILASTTVEPH